MSDKPKKALWKRWWVWVGGIIVIIIIAANAGGGNATTPAGNSAGGNSTGNVSTSKPVASKPTTKAATKPATKLAAPKVYKVGEAVKVGKITVTVHSVKYEKIIQNVLGNLSANGGEWMILNVTVKNDDTTSHTIDSSMFTALKGKSKYQASSNASMYINNNGATFFLDQLNPGLSETGNIAFDIPSSGKYQLQVSGGMVSLSSATINLY